MTVIYCVSDFRHEMQVITQVFFAHAKYVFCGEIPVKGLAVRGTSSVAEVYEDGALLASVAVGAETDVKRGVMLALFYALEEVTGKAPPWGALTGVRPSKQVRLWLEDGESEDTIAKRLGGVYHLREDKIRLAVEVARAEGRMILAQKPGVGVYVGIPFCPSRCLYCSFVTFQKTGKDVHGRYLAALAREYERADANAVYIGGGTPTAFSAPDFERLLNLVGIFPGVEYTVEAGRPDSITKEKLELMKAYGVTRIAINPQTLNDSTLERIGRAHTARDFFKAYELARQAGFDNINVDIIAGLPGEGASEMERTMDGLKSLAPAHITVHTLAVKRASLLNELRSEYEISGEIDKMLTIADETCRGLGLSPYYMYRQKNQAGGFENVGYARAGCECAYNIAMMAETGTVLGFGAGAVTKTLTGSLITRKFNPKEVETYIERMNNDDASTKRD